MPHIEKTIEIAAPRDKVFAYVTDMACQPEWATFIKRVEIISGDGKSAGTTDRCLIKLGPRSQEVEALWTEYQEPETFARKATAGATMQGRMTFAPSNGGTRVRWTIEYEPAMGLLGRMLDALFMNRLFQNEVEASLENLKAKMEE